MPFSENDPMKAKSASAPAAESLNDVDFILLCSELFALEFPHIRAALRLLNDPHCYFVCPIVAHYLKITIYIKVI